MAAPFLDSACSLSRDEAARTDGGARTPLGPPAPIICYWPVPRAGVDVAAALAASPRRYERR